MSRRISSIQQGLITEDELLKYLIMGSLGMIELAKPTTDDERRDFEIHIRNLFDVALALQVKSAMQLHRMSKNARYLYILFDVEKDRLFSSPFYYYFFAFLDPKLMRLADPCFLIPSSVFHELAAPRLRNGVWQFTFAASMEAETRDKWHEYRSSRLQLGNKMLQILEELERSNGSRSQDPGLFQIPDVYWVGARRNNR